MLLQSIFRQVVICLILGLTSCEQLIQTDPPKTLVSSEILLSDPSLLESALLGCYYSLDFEGGFIPYIGLYADELSSSSSSSSIPEFSASSLSANTNTGNYAVWKSLYSVIYQTNVIIEKVASSSTNGDTLLTRFVAEAKFLRALSYFYLVNIWGDVPILTTADVGITSRQPRDPVSAVYSHLIQDLLDAQNELPSIYPTGKKTRATRFAATALLARAYLYTGLWEKAQASASLVIDSGLYTAAGKLPALEKTFDASSIEAIFHIWNAAGYTAVGNMLLPDSPTTVPTYYLSAGLLDAFEKGDLRKLSWVSASVVNGRNYFFPFKYKVKNSGAVSEYSVMLRVSEQYLIRAQARANLNNLTGAIQDLNVVRERSGLTMVSQAAKEPLLDAIAKERRVELFCENAHRFFDLKRSGRIDAVMSPLKATWQSKAALFPIPLEELRLNSALTQNPSYN